MVSGKGETFQVVSGFPFSGVTAVALSCVGATNGMCQSPAERLVDQVLVGKKPSVVLCLLVFLWISQPPSAHTSHGRNNKSIINISHRKLVLS